MWACVLYVTLDKNVLLTKEVAKKKNQSVALEDEASEELNRNVFPMYGPGSNVESREMTSEERHKEFEERIHQAIDGNLVGILPVRGVVLFPGVLLPITVSRKKSLKLIERVQKSDELFMVCAQRESKGDYPDENGLYPVGTICRIVKSMVLPDGSTAIIVEGLKRAEIQSVPNKTPYLRAKVVLLNDLSIDVDKKTWNAVMSIIKDSANKIVKLSSLPAEVGFALANFDDDRWLVNYVCGNFNWKVEEKQLMLEMDSPVSKARHLITLLTEEVNFLELKQQIKKSAQSKMEDNQREYFLQQQKKAIEQELGEGDESSQDIERLKKAAKEKKWSPAIQEVFDREVNKMSKMPTTSSDYFVILNYVETLLRVPFGESTVDNYDIANAQMQLDKDHFGLKKVKERIIEFLSVMKLKKEHRSPILCLYGPPGVGKTSLGKSIASALNRQYARVSLGGLHDESEIRGHRRTYIGAMPGRIVQGLIKSKSDNPVFVLDEIDKVGSRGVDGDPSSALLELLDPEQNSTFHDNYLNVDLDLSHVLFIATANNVRDIPAALKDRMEMIEVNGYEMEEKVEIAKHFLMPRQVKEVGLSSGQLRMSEATIRSIISSYTRESGVRTLERMIGQVARKVACKQAMSETGETIKVNVKCANLKDYLGNVRFQPEKYEGNRYYGLVTGLAWTSVGGTTLPVESSVNTLNGGGKLTVTGNLGKVMSESVSLAYEYIKSHAHKLNIDDKVLEGYNVHMHFPEGAIPKDGPSAGITIVTSMVSSLSRRKVRARIAMTGEISLRGKVLPVGGIREKILAAKRAGIRNIVLCKENQRDVEEIDPNYVKGVTFHYVDDISAVLDYALLKSDGSLPIPFKHEKKEA